MYRPDTEFELTVREVLVRDRDTNDETTAWNVESEHMPRACHAETAAEALRITADCLEADADTRAALSVEQLAGD